MYINTVAQNSPEETDIAGWLWLFRLFRGTQEFKLQRKYSVYEVDDSPKMGLEMFPTLRILWVDVGWPVPRFIRSFVAERELTGRPTMMISECVPFV